MKIEKGNYIIRVQCPIFLEELKAGIKEIHGKLIESNRELLKIEMTHGFIYEPFEKSWTEFHLLKTLFINRNNIVYMLQETIDEEDEDEENISLD